MKIVIEEEVEEQFSAVFKTGVIMEAVMYDGVYVYILPYAFFVIGCSAVFL